MTYALRNNPRSTIPGSVEINVLRTLPVLPLVLLFSAFALRIMFITTESLWRDEIDVIRFSFAPMSELMVNLTRNGFNGPLYLLLMRLWFYLSGVSDFSLRYFSLVFGVLECLLVYSLTKQLIDRHAAILALWMSIVSPVLIWYSGEGKMYTLQPSLLLLAIYALRKAVDTHNSKRWWVVFVSAVSLGYYVHLLTPLFIAVAAVFYLIWFPHSRQHLRGAAIAFGLCTVPYIPLAIWQLPTLIAGSVTGHDYYTLDVMLLKLLYNWSVGVGDTFIGRIPDSFPLLGVLAFGGVAMVGLFAGIIRRPNTRAGNYASHKTAFSVRSTVVGLFAWAIVPVVCISIISTRAPVFEPRYLLWCAPAILILIGHGLSVLRRSLPMVTVLLVVVLTAISAVGAISQVVNPIRPDMRGMTSYVASAMKPRDLFVFQIPYTKYAFEYYMPMSLSQSPLESGMLAEDGLRTVDGFRERIIDAPYTNAGATPDDVTAALLPLATKGSRIWLIESEVSLWDTRSMVRFWFDEHMRKAQQSDLHGVSATLYETP